jgi:beta-lactamase superfamily II metal-dependent hydrolase
MKITFKDVQQGDSIIIEWKDVAGKDKVGIIDCHMKGTINPVLEHIRNAGYNEIAFMVLSHPHLDHYSGFLELLTHCEDNGIKIERFAHTLTADSSTYWKYFEWDTEAEEELQRLKQKWGVLKDKEIILRMRTLNDETVVDVDSGVSIRCLAPSHDDIEEYQRVVKLNAAENVSLARKAANLLSTILKIDINGYHFLFTSDAEKFAFAGAMKRDKKHFEGAKFHICQMAHHGSKNNHLVEFWDQIDCFKIQNAVASAGTKYKHPATEVVKYFYQRGYNVYCTNIVNGMKDHVDELEKEKTALNDFSRLSEEYTESDDRVFILSDNNIILQKAV